jgi:hypothetical protein
MRRPSLLKKNPTDTTQVETAQVIEFALNPPATVEHGPNGQNPPDEPPEGGYGWVVVGAVSLINGFTWGVAAVSLIFSTPDRKQIKNKSKENEKNSQPRLFNSFTNTVLLSPTASTSLTTSPPRTSPPPHPWTTLSSAASSSAAPYSSAPSGQS